MSTRFSSFRPKAVGLFVSMPNEERDELLQLELFPVATETPHGYYLRVRVPGIGYFLPKSRYEEVYTEWRMG